jgi:hypothetical protein
MWEEDIGADEGCCTLAARFGHLKVLKWLREQGCQWNAWNAVCRCRSGRAAEIVEVASGPGMPVGDIDV